MDFGFSDLFKVFPQYLLPQHALSRAAGVLTECRQPQIKDWLIRRFVSSYGVDLTEAATPNTASFASFNDFFTRALRSDVRPVCADPDALVSPADGVLSQFGEVDRGSIIQAKGRTYTVTELLGGDSARAAPFLGGSFATVYLSPRDYHRLHMPLEGTLLEMLHIPGRLFSVNQTTARCVPRLFARNERVVAIFATSFGRVALVLVGAFFVASIETVWHGVVTPPTRSEIRVWRYNDEPKRFSKGEEMGRFKLGSTIVVLAESIKLVWDVELSSGHSVRMGQRLAGIS